MNDFIGFAASTHDSDSSKVKLHLWNIQNLEEVQLNEIKKKKALVINFLSRDEKALVDNHISTVSFKVMMAILAGTPLTEAEIGKIIRLGYGLNYLRIVGSAYQDSLCQVLNIYSIRQRIAALIRDCVNLINIKGLHAALTTEIMLVPVLHSMQDKDYIINALAAKKALRALQDQLLLLGKRFKELYGCCYEFYSGNTVSALILQEQCVKLESKIARFPQAIRNGSDKSWIRISCSFESIGTRTFRITTNNENLQGFPKELRRFFCSRLSGRLYEYDLTSSQLIILSCLSEERILVKEYLKGTDLYMFLAEFILQKKRSCISEVERDCIKMLIIKLINGAGIKTLHMDLIKVVSTASIEDVKTLVADLRWKFPKIASFIDSVNAQKSIKIQTGIIVSSNKPNSMLSYILQNIEVDILKRSLINIYKSISNIEGIELYLCIHDAIFIDCMRGYEIVARSIVNRAITKTIQTYFPELSTVQVKEKTYE